MKNKRHQIINVQGVSVGIFSKNNKDYISLTDIAGSKSKDSRAADIIKNWIRTRTTLEFLGTWESLNNPNFKVVKFDHFTKQAGLPSFVLSPGQWVEKTGAVGIYVELGRYGGTYAHKDIAFEFGSAINPVFKLYLIKEYQRLKELENNKYNLEWNIKRIISKINYLVQTDSIKQNIISRNKYDKEWIIYAEEADILNVAVFGCTAKEWRSENPKLAKQNNIRDLASINELIVLSNLESHNADLINQNIDKDVRFKKLCIIAAYQLKVLASPDSLKSLKKLELMKKIV